MSDEWPVLRAELIAIRARLAEAEAERARLTNELRATKAGLIAAEIIMDERRARIEVAETRLATATAALEWYAKDDELSVEMGILEPNHDRPARAALAALTSAAVSGSAPSSEEGC